MLKQITQLLLITVFEDRDYQLDLLKWIQKGEVSFSESKEIQAQLVYVFLNFQTLSFRLSQEFSYLSPDEKGYYLLMASLSLADKGILSQEEYESLALLYPTKASFEMVLSEANKLPKIPLEVKKNPAYLFSVRFEFPYFATKDVLSRMTLNDARDFFSALSEKPTSFYLPHPDHVQDYLKDPRFHIVTLEDGTLLFSLKEKNSVTQEEIDSHRLIPILYPLARLLAQLRLPSLSPNVLLPENVNAYLGRILSLRMKESFKGKTTVVFSDPEHYYQARNQVVMEEKNPSFVPLLCEDRMLLSSLAPDSQDAVIVYGKDSGIGNWTFYPGIKASLSETKAKDNGRRALESLKEHALFVKKDGFLVYYSDSFLSWETSQVIEDFLRQRKGFEKVGYNPVSPTTLVSSSGFYAILRRTSS